jgi:1-acyl-sn-glycerol-3-phosphate acyltransferase
MPDVELKPQVYKDPRPAEQFTRFHERVRNGRPEWVYELIRLISMSLALTVFRARGYGSENVPGGKVILAPNHASFMDHFFTGAFIRRHVQFMAKSQLFTGAVPSYVYSHGGVFPVQRGKHDEEAFKTAFSVLNRGGVIGMYVEGGRSRSGEVGTEAKPGIGRLALQTGAPIVPIAILGSHQVRNWKRLRFPKVTVRYGEPFSYPRVEASTREQDQAVADEVLRRIRALHDELEQGHRRASASASAG